MPLLHLSRTARPPAGSRRSHRLLAALVGLASLATGHTALAQGTRFGSDASGNLILAAPGAVSAPVIVESPINQVVQPGGTASFSVLAQGTPPLTYQWRLRGTNLPGATTDSLILTNVGPAQVGTYSVTVSSGALTTPSANAELWLDTDRDGLPDVWEQQYFGSLTNQIASGDRDLDGVINLDELREGTVPTNAASLSPRLIVTAAGPGQVNVSPLATHYPLGDSIQLTAVPDAGKAFLGWSGDLGGAANPSPLVMSTTRRVTALFGIPLATALDTTDLVWTSGGDAGWVGQSVYTQDGVDAAQSAPIDQGGESWIETTVVTPRPVALDFFWRVSGTAGPGGTDLLTFSINGVEQAGRISGASAWLAQAHILSPGTHVLRWKFTKFSTSTRYADVHNGGFLDRVSLRAIAALSANPVGVVEGALGTRDAIFRVTLPEPVVQAASFSFYTTNGTALAGVDYVARTGTMTVPAGQTEASIAVAVFGDRIQEGNETFRLILHRPVGGYLIQDEGTGTILDDEIAPAGLALTAEDCLPANGLIDPGERVTVSFTLRNPGPLATAGLTARLLPSPGILNPSAAQDYGNIPGDGSTATRSFSFTANGPCGSRVTAVFALSENGEDRGQVAFTFPLGEIVEGTRTFTSAPVTLPATGNATPYPSSNIVSGVVGTVRKVTLTLIGLQHANPDDLDLLLVGPDGRSALVLSDAGGTADVTGLTVSFAADAASGVPDAGPLVAGTFRPTNIDTNTDAFTAPAPAGPYGSDLNGFNGINPNGAWRLFARDDAASNAGQIAGGWSLAIETFDAFCCQGPTQADLALSVVPVEPVVVGHDATLLFSITNSGPAAATAVLLTNSLPPGVAFTSVTPSQGTASLSGTNVIASLGNLPAGGAATVRLVARPTLAGTWTIASSVRSPAADPDYSNNDRTNSVTGLLPTLSIGDVTVADAPTNATFAVWLSAPTSLEVTALFASSNATALAGADYQFTNGLLRFAPGIVTQFIQVPIIGDAISEANETFTVRLSAPTNATLVRAIGTGTITDDDAVPSISVEPIEFVEGHRGTSNATFVVRLSAPSGQSITVRYATANGTAVAPGDYTARSGTLTFNAGVVTQLVTVPIVGDLALESDETLLLTLSTPVRATISIAETTATILNDELVPDGFELSSESCDPVNGQLDPGETVSVRFHLRNPGPLDATNLTATLVANPNLLLPGDPVTLTTVPGDGSAASVDFTFLANGWCGSNMVATLNLTEGTNSRGSLTYEFELGRITRTTNTFVSPTAVTVPAIGAATPYPSTLRLTGITGTVRTVSVTLSNLFHTNPDHLDLLLVGPLGQKVLLLSDAGGTLDITNLTLRIDDRAGAALPDSTQLVSGTFRPSNYDTTDALPAPAPAAPYGATLAAFQGLDPNGDWQLFLADDTANETGGLVGGWAITVETFDAECCVDVGASDLALGMARPVQPVLVGHDLVFTLTVTNPHPVTATGVTVTNPLPANTTFVSARGSQGDSFLAGGAVVTVLGNIPGFSSAEVTLTVAPNAPGSYTNSASVVADQPDPNSFNNLASTSGTAVVPTLAIADVLAIETDDANGAALFELTLSGFSSQPIWVRFATANGTALAGADYTNSSGLLLFPPGSTVQRVRVPLVGDLLNEAIETFVVNLSNPTNVTVSVNRGTATVIDNDPQPEIRIADVRMPEGNSGTSNAVFRLTLTAPSARPVSVNYATINGTAVAGSDYTTRSGTVTWPAGTTEQTLLVPILGDVVVEPDESFLVVLSRPVDAVLNLVTALGTIVNDEILDSVRILTVTVETDVCHLTFQSAPGRTYKLERTAVLASDAVWETVSGAGAIPGTGELITLDDPFDSGLETRFYRLTRVQ